MSHPLSPVARAATKATARIALGTLMLVGAVLAPCAIAQKYPERPVRIVNTFPAGGSGDVVLRTVFDRVGSALGQPFVIDTRTGAAGAIGSANIATAAPDGYSLLLGTASTFGTNSATQKNLPYDPVRDFTPIVMIATTPYLLLTHPSVPANTLPEFLAHARANPGKLNYGSFGLGSSNHLSYELLRQATGMDIVHVPYKGGAPLIIALLAGEIQSSMDVYATAHAKPHRSDLATAPSDLYGLCHVGCAPFCVDRRYHPLAEPRSRSVAGPLSKSPIKKRDNARLHGWRR